MQLLCKCKRIIGGFDDRYDNKIYHLSNVRRVTFVPRPGNSNSEISFDIQEIQGIVYDFPIPEVLKSVRILSHEEKKDQCDVIIRRATLNSASISYYDQVNRYINANPSKIVSNKNSKQVEIVDLTENDHSDISEVIELENSISNMSVSSSSTEQFSPSKLVQSLNESSFSVPNCTSTPGLQEMNKSDVLNTTFILPDNMALDQLNDEIAENAVPINNINNEIDLENIFDDVDVENIIEEYGSFNSAEIIDFYFDYNN